MTDAGAFALDKQPVLIAFGGHVENPVDAQSLLALWWTAPKVGRGQNQRVLAPNVIKRKHVDFLEKLSGWLMGDLVCQVSSAPRREELEARKKTPEGAAEVEREERDRIAFNQTNLKNQVHKVLTKSEQMLLYPEGTVTGNGRISISKTRALEAMVTASKAPVAIILATHTYDPLMYPKIQPFVNFAKSVVVIESSKEKPFPREKVAGALEVALSRLNVVTGTGLIGAYLLHAREEGRTTVTRAELESMLARVAEGLAAAKSEGLEITIDPLLLDPRDRKRALDRAFDRLVEGVAAGGERRPYLRERGDTYELTDALSPRVELEGPPASDIPSKHQRRDPLGYWGTRTEQHMRNQPKFQALARRVFDDIAYQDAG